PMNPVRNSVAVKRRGEALGFDAIGVASLERNAHADALDRWLAAGYAGTMSYLHRQAEQRKLPHRIMPEATVAVVTLTSYFHGAADPKPAACDRGKVAQYAWTADYHRVVGRRLERLASAVRELAPVHLLPPDRASRRIHGDRAGDGRRLAVRVRRLPGRVPVECPLRHSYDGSGARATAGALRTRARHTTPNRPGRIRPPLPRLRVRAPRPARDASQRRGRVGQPPMSDAPPPLLSVEQLSDIRHRLVAGLA